MVKRKSAVGRVLGVGSVVLGLAFLGGAQIRATQLVDKIDHETELREATSCVNAHKRIGQIRDSVEFVIRTNADTLLQLATPESDPERIRRFQELVEGDVQEARQTIKMPNCDLAKAEAVVETEEG